MGFEVSLKGDKFQLQVQDDDPVVTLTVARTVLQIDGNGNVKLEGAGKLEIKSDGDLTLDAGGNAEIKAGGTMKLSASKIDIN